MTPGDRALRAASILSLALPLVVLATLVGAAVKAALPRLGWSFLTSFPSRFAEGAGILSALAGSAWLLVLTLAMAVPVGLGAALYLEEYAPPGRLTSLIELNIANLAGVPSIIHGLLGLEIFVRVFGLGRSLLAGAATLALLLLPMVIMTSREALRSVPLSLREASFALGADRWQTIRQVVLPMSMPGILTGVMLSLARAAGETAPLVMIGALTYVAFVPSGPMDAFTALPIQIFNWLSRPQAEFRANAAAAVVVLLVLMLSLNATAIWLRARLEKPVQ
ncbi:phosphate ABC transporter permease PstA [Polyangium aurulentum]|uniref:phosphate ABC transporter permease PstA n=1 Tax=Polyangium aurulentum TaxID=2567896 RepID=UPI0010AE08F5|nr:phosphate ABC transporter permease PstA [Polyangium aurulentum]UQA58889.1 phosphate ABC transporter permease PstA [Polyangium aurulentum]